VEVADGQHNWAGWRRIAEVWMRLHRSRFQLGTIVCAQIGISLPQATARHCKATIPFDPAVGQVPPPA
jgi:hypothetical protein